MPVRPPACHVNVPPVPDPRTRRRRGALALGLALLAAAGLAHAEPPTVAPAAVPALPPVAVSPAAIAREVEVVDFDWTDAQRQRPVPARLYLPRPPAGGVAAPAPLIVFSHGLGGSRFGYSHLGRHWAEQGFASLHVQHQGSDRAVWTSSLLELYANMQAAVTDAQAIARAKDVSFGIGRVLSEPSLAGRIDGRHIAVAGHSYGANTALLVAGAVVAREVDGQWRDLSLRDERVRAAVLLSTPPFHGETDAKAVLGAIAVPTLHVTGTEDVIRVPGYRSEPADRIRLFDAMPSGPGTPPRALAVFTGATHSIFTDRTDRAGPELNRVVKAATRELTTEFLRAVLKDAPFDGVTRWLDTRAGLLARRAAVGPVAER